MIINSVTVTRVRNHNYTVMPCTYGMNVLVGRNGVGKTSILEGISMCALAKSFVPVADVSLIQQGKEEAIITVAAMRDTHIPYSVTVGVRKGLRKSIQNTIGNNLSPKDLVGELPIVALSPDHKAITFGGPADRRSFLDGMMAQCSKRVTELLYEHRRLLKHRNALLSEEEQVTPELMDTVTDAFIAVSAELVQKRTEFVAQFAPRVHDMYEMVSGSREHIQMVYEPHVLAQDLHTKAKSLAIAERARGITLFGPQKDDIGLYINQNVVKETASQGQHKSLLVALKLAEAALLQERCSELPVVLLDDLFAELDNERCARVLSYVQNAGLQCFITGTDVQHMALESVNTSDVQVVNIEELIRMEVHA